MIIQLNSYIQKMENMINMWGIYTEKNDKQQNVGSLAWD